MKRSLPVKVMIPIAIGGLLLAGCSSDEGGGTEDGTSSAAVSETLRVNYGSFPENWAPGQAMEGGTMRVPYETLLAPPVDGVPQPFLATDFELTPESLTLTLREGVTFHDGTPFNAEAVKANVDYVQQGATASAGSLAAISSVEVVDDSTVTFHLSEPNPALPNTLTTRALPIASPAALEDGSISEHPVGTSPWAYVEDESVLGTRLMFGAYDDYWGETPGFANVQLFAIGEPEAAAAALLNDEIDVSEVEPEVLPRFDGTEVESINYPAIRNNVIFFDRGPGGVFESEKVRQAFCYAMDEEQYAEISGDTAATQHFEEGEIGYNADIDGYPHDVEKAKELLDEADSPSISLDLVAASYNAHQLEIYMQQAAEAGIQANVEAVPPPQFQSEWGTAKYPLALGSNDEATPFEWYKAYFAADAPANPSGIESDELKQAADAAIAAGASDEAAELWGEVTEIIADEALTCTHIRGVETIAWNSSAVSGVAEPDAKWEPQLVNYRGLVPADA